MPYPNAAIPDIDTRADAAVIDQSAPRYGVAVRDIFSDAGWTPVEPVRARDWHDCRAGACIQSSETTFD